MPTSRYQAIADTLRERIAAGTYPVGGRLPSIVELQREFDVPGLNTIRDAQQVLVREQLLRTEQGVGAFVIAQSSPHHRPSESGGQPQVRTGRPGSRDRLPRGPRGRVMSAGADARSDQVAPAITKILRAI